MLERNGSDVLFVFHNANHPDGWRWEYRLSFVDFDEDFNLTEGFNIELDNVFDMMDRNPGMRAEIGVYCSNGDGEEAANGTRKVAQTVAGYIQSRGIDASRISSKSGRSLVRSVKVMAPVASSCRMA